MLIKQIIASILFIMLVLLATWRAIYYANTSAYFGPETTINSYWLAPNSRHVAKLYKSQVIYGQPGALNVNDERIIIPIYTSDTEFVNVIVADRIVGGEHYISTALPDDNYVFPADAVKPAGLGEVTNLLISGKAKAISAIIASEDMDGNNGYFVRKLTVVK